MPSGRPAPYAANAISPNVLDLSGLPLTWNLPWSKTMSSSAASNTCAASFLALSTTLPQARLIVARQLERSVEALFVITAVDDQPEVLRERKVLRLNEVLAPDRDRVHADLARDQVNHPLDKMGRLGSAGSAVGVGRHLVGEHPDRA